jgi:hypothetical protein
MIPSYVYMPVLTDVGGDFSLRRTRRYLFNIVHANTYLIPSYIVNISARLPLVVTPLYIIHARATQS